MTVDIRVGDAREVLAAMPAQSVHMALTSPPYWGLRGYKGGERMIGLEPTWEEHLDNLLAVFREVWRVLRDDGICVVNYGDAYAATTKGTGGATEKQSTNAGSFHDGGRKIDIGSFKPKDLMMMPSRVAMALQSDGWFLRSMIPWIKKNPMPESVTDRPTNAVEYFFLFAKKKTYFWDAVAVRKERTSVEDANGFRGGSYTGGQPGPRATTGNKRTDKQRGHGRRHDGFNDRWDAMSKDEQQAGGANMRNYLFEATAPFKGAHFATFPPSVIEPFILAATSAKGCCPECGAPWTRMTKKQVTDTRPNSQGRNIREGLHYDKAGVAPSGYAMQNAPHGSASYAYRTLRWEPSCECKAGKPVPCTVLDPFAGAGTTGLVADRHQRNAVLIEISKEYADLARKRIHEDAPLLIEM